MDLHCSDNLYDSFSIYQSNLIEQFDQLAEEYGFITIDANRSITMVFDDIRQQIMRLFEKDSNS
jgi:dTMP kinase